MLNCHSSQKKYFVKMQDIKERTKKIALRTIRLAENLPESKISNIIANQIMSSATSVGANYRASQRAKSTADFANKLKIVEEELDETLYWIELIEDLQLIKSELLKNIKQECDELIAIMVSSIKKVKKI